MSESNWDSQGMVTCTDGESSDRMDHKASLFQNLKLKKSRLKRLMANSDSAMESDYVVSSIGSSEIDMGSQYSSSDEADSGYGSTRHRRRKVLKFHPKTDNKTTSTHVKEARKEHSSKSKQAPSFGFAYYGIPPGMIHGQTAPNPESDTESSGQRRPSIGFIPVLTSMIPQYSGSAGNTTDTESPSSGDTSSLDNDIKPVILTQFPPAFIMTAKGPMPVINACGPGGISQFPILKMNSSEPKKAEQFVQMLTPSQLAGMQASQSKRESESQRNSAYNQKEQTKTGAQDYSFIEHYTNGNFEYKGILKKEESLTSENAPVPMATVAQACPYDDQEEQLVCAICNDRATGLHYGIITCEGCKGFFKRTVQNKRVYNCVGNGNCVINKLQRNRCQFCRFKKCLQMGMVLAAVREDRMPGGRNSGAVYNLYKVKYKKHKKKDQMVKLFKEQVAQIKVDGNDGKIETEMITERKRIPLPYVSFNKGEMPHFVQEDHRSQMRHNSAFSRSTKRSTPPQPSWDSCSLSSMCSSDASVAWNFSDKSYDNGPCFVPTNESQNDKSRVTYEERLANDATRKHENQFHNTGQHGGSSFVSQGPVNPNCKNNHLANLLQSKQDTIPRTEHQVRPCNPEFASQVFSSREDVQYSRDTTPAATFDKPDGLQKCVNSNNTPTRTLSTLMNYNVSRSVKSGTACEYLSTVGDHNAQARLGREQCGDTNEFVSGNYKCGVNQSRHCQQEFSPRMKNRDVSEQGLYKPPAQNATDCRMLEYTTTAAHCPQTVTTNDTSPHKCYSYNNQFSERTIEKQTQNFIGEYRKKEQCYRPKECFSQAMARDYSNERHYPHESDTKVFVQHQPRKERVSHPYKDSRCSPVTHRTNSLHESQRDFTQTYLQYQHSVSLSRENSDQHSSDHKTLDFGRHSGTVSDTNPCNTTGNDVKSVHNDTSQTNTEAPSVWHQQHTEHLRPDPVRKTDSKTHLDYQEAHEFNKTRSSDHSGIIQTHGLCDQNGFHVDMHCYNVSEIDTSRSNNDNSTRDPYQVREPETEDHVTDESHVTDENHVTDDCYQFSERPSLEDTVHNSDPLRCNQKSDKSKTGCHEQDGQYSNPSPELCSPKSHSQLIQELVNCNTLLDISDSFNFDENDWIDSDITDNFYRLADQIVDKLVAWTRHLPFYSEIPLNVHSNILTSRWHELLVLMTAARRTLTLQEDPRSTHITYNILLNSNMQKLDSFLSRISRMDKDTATMDIQKVRDIMERLSMIMFRFLQMRVGIQEFVSLQVILLLNHNDPSQHAKIETMQQKYTNALEWYVTKTFPKDPTRLGELLIRIPEIQTTSSLLLKNKMIYIPFFLNS